jgi:hypothetical protein
MDQTSLDIIRRHRTPRNVDYQIEWGDAADCRKVFGLRQSTLYQLHYQGRVKSTVLRTKGRGDRGKRLFNFASIRELLASQEIPTK